MDGTIWTIGEYLAPPPMGFELRTAQSVASRY